MFRCFRVIGFLTALLVSSTYGQEHSVEVIQEDREAPGVSKEVDALFSPAGLRVLRGTSRTVCEFWPCKEWETIANFQATSGRLYPFKPGQLIGLLHFQRRGKDFREQSIKSGWYTLRYALQPIDGNHEGTSPTRDFLVMVRAEDDKSPKPFAMKELLTASAKAAGASHPAMLCLQPSQENGPHRPSMRHIEDRDWWVLQFAGKGTHDGKSHDLTVDLIVAGHADE